MPTLRLPKRICLDLRKLSAMVVSDFAGGNMVEGLLIVQDKRRLNELRANCTYHWEQTLLIIHPVIP